MHEAHVDTTNRMVIVKITPVLMARMLMKWPDNLSMNIKNHIPSTAYPAGAEYSHELQSFLLYMTDESFDEVVPGERPPEWRIEVTASLKDDGARDE